MATQTSSVTRWTAVAAAVLIVAGLLAGCTPRPDGPGPAAEQFFTALATGNTSAAAALSDKPDDAKAALNSAWAGLQATQMDAQILGSTYDEDTGSVDYRYTWHLPKNRTWSYEGRLSMIREEGHWLVRWTPAGLHPKLGEHQTFALRADPPQRASVNEVGGTDVLKPGFLYHYELDAKKAGGQLMPTVRALVDAFRQFDPSFDAQRLAEQASAAGQPVDLITLRPDDNNKLPPALAQMPGVIVTPQPDLLPTDYGFAPALVAQVKKTVMAQLDGEAGWRVVTVNQNGVDVGVLNEVQPTPAPSVSMTLDRSIQNAAQRAVANVGREAMIVVIRPSTGAILAVAQNAAADKQGPLATTGLFPPGSTFKIVTAGAAISRDMATPNTMLGCPGVRQFVQHHFRRARQPDAAHRAVGDGRAVRDRRRLRRRRSPDGDGQRTADREPRRAH
jgi:hypothetical protein